MKKVAYFLILSLLFVNIIIPSKPALAITGSLSSDDAYQGIVQVKAYTNDIYDHLYQYSAGSGVVISSDGLVLTNYHVVAIEDSYDDTIRDSAYQICIPTTISEEPECHYMAKLVAMDKDLDIAILKLQSIPGLSSATNFSYLKIASSDSSAVNDFITVLGYPAIGGSTITITTGIISGKADKYNRSWLKTDAVISFGSSGGAVINSDGTVIGITSNAYSDLAGSLGYAINMESISDWINSNKTKTPQVGALSTRLATFTKLQNELKNSNTYNNIDPYFRLTKSSEWEFWHSGEDRIYMDDPSDGEGGYVTVTIADLPLITSTEDIIPSLHRQMHMSSTLSMIDIIKDEDVTINGMSGKKISLSAIGDVTNAYYFPIDNYLIELTYSYGYNDKDKDLVDSIINSFTVTSSNGFSESHSYINNNPYFTLKTDEDWPILAKHSNSSPLLISNKNIRVARADIDIDKTDDRTINFTNEEYLAEYKQLIEQFNQISYSVDLKIDIVDSNDHYVLSDELNDVIMVEYISRSISTGERLAQNRDYFIRTDDRYIVPSINIFSNESDVINQAKEEFELMLQGLSLTGDSQIPFKNETASNQAQTQTQFQNQEQVYNGDDPTRFISSRLNNSLVNRVRGKLLLAVEDRGRIFYTDPDNGEKWEVTFANALHLFESLSLGISNSDLEAIPLNTDNWTSATGERLKGKLLLQVEDRGRIWYVDFDGKRWEVTWNNLMELFESLSLGITNDDLTTIPDPE